jgi:hypothetical protein
MGPAILLLVLAATPGQVRSGPILVELFSSEGCSSCPPAEALLREKSLADPSLIALEFHVDYWNSLGWADRFSSPAFSDRQSRYAAARGTEQIFTPQVIVDGHESLVGSDGTALSAALERAPQLQKATLTLQRSGDRLEITGEAPAGELWIAVTEAGLETIATRGENRGRHLVHAPVVRSFRELSTISAGPLRRETTLALDPSWKRAALRVVAAIQDPVHGTVRALGSIPFGN